MTGVVIENLAKQFPGPRGHAVTALAGVSLAVGAGELLVLVGPSGCGKTTLLRLVAGLERPSGGTITIDGRPMAGVPPQDRDVAMVFQNHALFPHLSVYDNLAFGLRLRRVPRGEAGRRVQETAEMLGLAECLGRRPQELSGGQLQRAALGRALVRRPKLLLLDEPLSSLDLPLRLQLRAEISRVQRQLAATVIYVTHDQAEALALGDRLAVLDAGSLRQVAPPLELYRRPEDVFVARFIGSLPMNLLAGTRREGQARLWFKADPPATLELGLASESAPRAARGRRVLLGIRPEDISRVDSAEAAVAPATVLAVVELVQPLGAETHLHVRAGGCVLVAQLPGADPARPKETLDLRLRRVHLFDADTGRALR